MSNKSVLEKLLSEIKEYEVLRKNRDAFSQRVVNSLDALEGVPYSVITQARDWQYKIETDGYFDEEGFESETEEVIQNLKVWVNELMVAHS